MPDLKSLSRNDQLTLGAGLLIFIVSFFPWYGYSIKGVKFQGVNLGGGSYSIDAWHSYSTLALLLVLAGAVVAAAAIFASSSLPDLPASPRLIAAGLFALGTLLELIRLLTLHHGDGLSIKWGGYLLAILMIAGTVVAGMTARGETGASAAPAAPPI